MSRLENENPVLVVDLNGPFCWPDCCNMTLQMIEIKPDQRVTGRADVDVSKGALNQGFYPKIGKRLLDCLLIVAASPLVLFAIVAMAVVVATDGKNPFYSQLRIGRGGEKFRLWKMRTMSHDADQRLAAYLDSNPDAKAEWDHHQKLKNDPRITKVGNFLRRTSLDELPQLLNVLTGAMSLVGPRPMMVDQDDLYHGSAYYELRPGLTGLWQTSDRNASSFAARVAYDEEYGRTVSLKTDALTLWRTIAVVFRGTGY